MQAQLLLVLFFAVFTIKASKVRPIEYDIIVEENRKSVVAKIIEVLQGREEMANVIRYLELAGRDLENKLPKFDQDGKEIPYVFFAPTAWAFITTVPHNVGDLFIHDTELRLNVLLRHFASNFSDNLLQENVKALRMADGKDVILTHTGQEHLINDRVLKAFDCCNASETKIADYPIQIYIVDGLFVVQQEINSAISRYISRQRPPASRPSADDVNRFKMSSPITTHVLNTATGTPGRNILVSLHRKNSDSSWEVIKSGQTNEDGRLPGLITKEQFTPGTYKMFFDTGAYFEALKITTFYPQVEVVFNIINELEHYHIPLLISPYGYSTYRGS